MSEALNALGEAIVAALPGAVTGHTVAYSELTITAQAADIVKVVTFLRNDPRCDVGNAARRETHNDAHAAGRISLCVSEAAE